MKPTDFAEYLSSFLTMHLPAMKGVSPNTVASYRDTFKLILQFAEEKKNIRSERLMLTAFNADFVEAFLAWLRDERGSSRSTCNNRLAAIRSFAKYVKRKRPEFLMEFQNISDIDFMKDIETTISYLSPETVKTILAQPDTSTRYGRRDLVLLSLLYDSGARVQEICDLRVRDIRLQKPYTVILNGKGSKIRAVPIMDSTAVSLQTYLNENRLTALENLDAPLFVNHQRTKLTRAGITYILKKYCAAAEKSTPVPHPVSPHVLRHSKAMHLLQAGINIVYIRDLLGHKHVETTEVYAKADTEMKRKEIERAKIPTTPDLPDWATNKPLMALLTNICGAD